MQELHFNVRAGIYDPCKFPDAETPSQAETQRLLSRMHEKQVFYVLPDITNALHPDGKTQAYELVTTFLKNNPQPAWSVTKSQPKVPKGAKPVFCGSLPVVLALVKEAIKRWKRTEQIQYFLSGGDMEEELRNFADILGDKANAFVIDAE